ncbi:MAG: GNAT family N-acetyltransferase [Deltaproteobacteria bacterium]|jgi:GNAT superfamily N-acetyltransferase|nr:GNAT family N-acetyltransferase [Deltaproteobacteria bacterium]
MKLRFALLSKEADRRSFSCGVPELDAYMHHQAGQDAARGFASVVVATEEGSPAMIIGYYTLSAASIPLTLLPEDVRGKMPRYRNIPAVLLGRLAVAQTMHGRHTGSLLLFDALRRACANELAWAVFLVDAQNDRAVAFYEKFCFARFCQNPNSLWLTRKQAERLVQ